jgi:hypothetical protein
MSEKGKQGRPSKALKAIREAEARQRQQEAASKQKTEIPQPEKKEEMTNNETPEHATPPVAEPVKPAIDISGDYDPFQEKIIERDYATNPISQVGGAPQPVVETEIAEPEYKQPLVDPNVVSEGAKPDDTVKEKAPVNPALKELSEPEKRKAAKQTSKMLVHSYCQLAPKPFIHISSFSIPKMEKMAMNKEIDMDMRLQTGETSFTTVKEYATENNAQVEEVFKVKEETREAIEDALTDVLMEQGMALTPTQMLGYLLVSHLTEMTMATFSLVGQKKDFMETIVKFKMQETAKEAAPVEFHESTNPHSKKSDDIQTPEVEVLD